MKKISLLLTLTLLLSPLSTLAREVTPSPLVNIYHYTFASTSSTPPMVMSVLPVDEEGSALFVVTPYVGEVATDTLLVLDQELLSFISKIATSTYGYDQNDMRTFLTDGGYTTIFPNMYFSSSTGNTGTTTKYIYAGGLLVSTIEKATSTRLLRYSFADPLQSASVITDATGQTIQETIDYMPYGAVRVDSKSNGYGGTKKGYIQSERDSSGLNYMNARYYEGVKGKFVSQDPVSRDIGTILLPSPSNSACASNWSGNTMSGNSSTCGSEKNGTKPGYLINVNGGALPYSQLTLLTDPQMLNSYSYGRNNPITMSDPSGLWAVAITLNLGAEIGAGPGIGGTVGGGWAYASGNGSGGQVGAVWNSGYIVGGDGGSGRVGWQMSGAKSNKGTGVLGGYAGVGIGISFSRSANTIEDIAPNGVSMQTNYNIPAFKVQHHHLISDSDVVLQ